MRRAAAARGAIALSNTTHLGRLIDGGSLRTLSGMKQRPASTHEPSVKLAVVIEKPEYDLTKFKVPCG